MLRAIVLAVAVVVLAWLRGLAPFLSLRQGTRSDTFRCSGVVLRGHAATAAGALFEMAGATKRSRISCPCEPNFDRHHLSSLGSSLLRRRRHTGSRTRFRCPSFERGSCRRSCFCVLSKPSSFSGIGEADR